MIRRIAGWCVLALIPLTVVTFAAVAGQLTELGVGAVIAAFIMLAATLSNHLLRGDPRRRN